MPGLGFYLHSGLQVSGEHIEHVEQSMFSRDYSVPCIVKNIEQMWNGLDCGGELRRWKGLAEDN